MTRVQLWRSDRMRIVLLALVVVTVAAPLARGSALPTGPTDPHIADGSAARKLAAARVRWKHRGFASYRFTVSQSCFCGPRQVTATITVRAGKRSGATERLLAASSVPRLFALVDNAINADVAGLTVTYDKRRGYVRHVYIDRSAMIADEEVGYDVRGLVRVTPRA